MRKPLAEQGADGIEIEQFLHQRFVIRHRINHIDLRFAQTEAAGFAKIACVFFGDFVFGDLLSSGEDLICDLLWMPGHHWGR